MNVFKLQFNFNKNDKLIESTVGDIFFQNYFKKLESGELREVFKSGECEFSYIDNSPYDLCVLNNKTILVIHDGSIGIYNEFFNLIQSIEEIDNVKFNPASVVSNGENQVYISDWSEHQIIMTDFELSKIRSYCAHGTGVDELSRPWSLSFNSNILYVCDFNNKSLKLFSKDLEFLQAVKLNYSPWQMKVSDKVVCVNAYTLFNTYFYSKNDFSLLYIHNHQQCRLSEINSYFYGYNYKSNEIYCYDECGDFIESIGITRTDENDSHCDDGCIFYFDASLFISLFKNKRFMKFKRN